MKSGEYRLSRRTFLKLGAVGAAAAILPRSAFGAGNSLVSEKSLALYNTHTGEKLKSVYWVEGNYVADSLREINYLLRDPRNNEAHDIDTRLLDLVFAIRQEIDAKQPFHVISGYRSADTNAFLRAHSTGVAENSLHLVGKAIDIRLPGRDTRSLQKAAMSLKGGGVGFYPKSDFVHIDIGRVRYW
jgi:uncharacterized protein YcbK (DUF882 family)